jgi:hypothetical protein
VASTSEELHSVALWLAVTIVAVVDGSVMVVILTSPFYTTSDVIKKTFQPIKLMEPSS